MSLHYTGDFKQLEQMGIIPLTGESCSAGFRLLCDVTEKGRKIILDFFGLPQDTKLAANWNRGVGDEDEHVGSIMLSYDMLPDIAAWAMAFHGATHIQISRSGYVAGYTIPEETEEWKKVKDTDERLRKTLDDERKGDCRISVQCALEIAGRLPRRSLLGSQILKGRETHQMTGRRM